MKKFCLGVYCGGVLATAVIFSQLGARPDEAVLMAVTWPLHVLAYLLG
jgi:hypothetical protein